MKDRTAQKHVTTKPFGELVAEELGQARAGHAKLNSAHEGYAVILEELCEFWDWCRLKREQRLPAAGLEELVQVGAMAQRLAEDLGLCAPPATMTHDAGAVAHCSSCGRYSMDPATLGPDAHQPACDCGERHSWCGSFTPPGPDAQWVSTVEKGHSGG